MSETVATHRTIREAKVTVYGLPAWRWRLEELKIDQRPDGSFASQLVVLNRGWYPRIPFVTVAPRKLARLMRLTTHS